jgi:hypothetical protein
MNMQAEQPVTDAIGACATLPPPRRNSAAPAASTGPGGPYRVSALSAAPAYSSAARQQYQAATDR